MPDQHAIDSLEEPQAPTPDLHSDDAFGSMMSRFDEAAQLLGLDPDLYTLLRRPDRGGKTDSGASGGSNQYRLALDQAVALNVFRLS